jgi:hypothetical protein
MFQFGENTSKPVSEFTSLNYQRAFRPSETTFSDRSLGKKIGDFATAFQG